MEGSAEYSKKKTGKSNKAEREAISPRGLSLAGISSNIITEIWNMEFT